MKNQNLKTGKESIKSLIKDAQVLFEKATKLTGHEASEIHRQGIELLDTAMWKLHTLQENTLSAGKEAFSSTKNYAQKDPWHLIILGVVLGFLIGISLTYYIH